MGTHPIFESDFDCLTDMESFESILWKTKIPLQISLAVSDERSNNCGNSSKLHLSVPTVSYLPLISNQVRNHFKPENENSQLWFSFKGSPIRWHLPIGILSDLYRIEEKQQIWRISAHFSDFPEELEDLDQSLVESSFRMSVKEADQIRTRSERTNTFQTTDYKRLWASVKDQSLDDWRLIAEKLLTGSEDKNVPVKFHFDCKYFQTQVEKSENLDSALSRALPASFSVDNFKILYFGFEIDRTVQISDLECLTYPDTFIHLVLQAVH